MRSLFVARGTSLFNLGRYPEALSAYNKATELNPADAAAWNGVGASYHNLGREQEAMRTYQRSLEIDPENTYAMGNLDFIKNRVNMNTTTFGANANSSASELTGKYILVLNLAHRDLLHGKGVIQVFNYDNNETLLYTTLDVARYPDSQYLVFDPHHSGLEIL